MESWNGCVANIHVRWPRNEIGVFDFAAGECLGSLERRHCHLKASEWVFVEFFFVVDSSLENKLVVDLQLHI